MTTKANPIKFGYPNASIILATWGEKMIKAIENVANTIPTYSLRICFSSNTGGKNGADSA